MDKIIENNEKPNQDALAILFTIPFMTEDKEKKKELIYTTVKMALKLNISDKNLFIEIRNNQFLLAQAVLDTEEFLNYMKVVKMLDEEDVYKLAMYEKQAKETLALKKGEKKGEENVVRKLLEDGFEVVDVLNTLL